MQFFLIAITIIGYCTKFENRKGAYENKNYTPGYVLNNYYYSVPSADIMSQYSDNQIPSTFSFFDLSSSIPYSKGSRPLESAPKGFKSPIIKGGVSKITPKPLLNKVTVVKDVNAVKGFSKVEDNINNNSNNNTTTAEAELKTIQEKGSKILESISQNKTKDLDREIKNYKQSLLARNKLLSMRIKKKTGQFDKIIAALKEDLL
jgi:hypothetical protein